MVRPFDDPPGVEDDLRAQIRRLRDERRDLVTAIDLLHRATANLQADNDRLRARVAHLERRKPRRWLR